jgi:hypothetical protein
MDRQFLLRIFDKGISLLVFIFLLKKMVSYGADITMLFWGSIFGFLISLNQDLRIKNYVIVEKINNGIEIFISLLLNNLVLLSLLLFSNQGFLNIALFYFVSSGRFDNLKYESSFRTAQFQNSICLFFSLSFYFVISLFRTDAEILSVIFYIIMKSFGGEIYLFSLCNIRTKSLHSNFDIHLALSGSLIIFIGYVIPTILSFFIKEPEKLLYHIAAIQRSISPAQQIGSMYSRYYGKISELLKNMKLLLFLSVVLSILMYVYLMAPTLDLLTIALIAIISFYSTISGSWTIKMIARGRPSIELRKTLVAIVFSVVLVPVLMLLQLPSGQMVATLYVTYLFFLYVPFIHFYR